MDDSERLISEEELKIPLTHEQKLQLFISELNNENLYFLKNSHNKKWDEFSFDERLDFKRRKIDFNSIGSRLSFGDKNEIYLRLNHKNDHKHQKNDEILSSEEELKTPLTHEQAKKLQLLISKVLPEFERFLRRTKDKK